MDSKYNKYCQYDLHDKVADKRPEIKKKSVWGRTLNVVASNYERCKNLQINWDILKKDPEKAPIIEENEPKEVIETPVIEEPKVSESEKVETFEETLVTSQNEIKPAEEAEVTEENFGEYTIDIQNENNGVVSVLGIKPLYYKGDVVIPDGVTNIAKEAFKGARFRSIKLPQSLRYLGDGCFFGCKFIQIDLPKGITAIPHRCFSHSYLQSIDLRYIKSIGNESFEHTNLEEVNILNDVAQIGIGSFKECHYLKKVTHRDTLKRVRSYAFAGCYNLKEFDFRSLEGIEEGAFSNTGFEKATLPGALDYIKTGTITGDGLKEVILQDGITKLGDGSIKGFVSNQKEDGTYEDGGLVIEIPRSVVNIDSNFMKPYFTIRCYSKTVAESAAQLQNCKIIYLDDAEMYGNRKVQKADMLNMNIDEIITNTIVDAYSQSDSITEVELPNNILNIELTDEMQQMLNLKLGPAPEDYEEKTKFKRILNHLANVAPLAGHGLNGNTLKCRETFTTSVEHIYNDGVSLLLNVTYQDNRYLSQSSKMLIAITGNKVRYICFPNRYTNISCKSPYTKDLSQLIEWLSPGDTIGMECMIRGAKVDRIVGDSSILLKDITNNKKKYGNHDTLKVNILQALMYTCIVIRLEGNNFVMYSPADGVAILCASQGKSTWANENEDSYKNSRAVILDIKNYSEAQYFKADARLSDHNDSYLKEIAILSDIEIASRLADYSIVKHAVISKYLDLRNIVHSRQVNSIEKATTKTVMIMMGLPIIEERTDQWFDKAIKKTITPAKLHRINLSDGGRINQYQTVHRVAMKNKLLIAGNRTMYIYEILNKYGNRLGVYAGDKPIEEQLKSFINSIRYDSTNVEKVYTDKSKFDTVDADDVAALVALYNVRQTDRTVYEPVWLVMYRPNGYYYIAYRNYNKYVLVLQLGDLDAAFDYISEANSLKVKGAKEIVDAGSKQILKNQGKSYSLSREDSYQNRNYNMLLEARALAIDGVITIDDYKKTGLPPVLCHLIGVGSAKDNLYELPEIDQNYPEELKLSNEHYSSLSSNESEANILDYSSIEMDIQDFDEGESVDFGDDQMEDYNDSEISITEDDFTNEHEDYEGEQVEDYSDPDISLDDIDDSEYYGEDDGYYEEGLDESDFEEEASANESDDDLGLLQQLNRMRDQQSEDDLGFDSLDSADDLL